MALRHHFSHYLESLVENPFSRSDLAPEKNRLIPVAVF